QATAALAWAGMAAILLAAVTFNAATPFPGYAALLPVAGTALVILAAARGRYSPAPVLGLGPVQWLGGASYSVYLWHWPIIVLWPGAAGTAGPDGTAQPPDPATAAQIIALTLLLAAATKTLVEDRFRLALPARRLAPTYRFAAVGMATVALLGTAQLAEAGYRQQLAAQQLSAASQSRSPCIGAAAIAQGFDVCPPDPAAQLVPDPALARDDLPAVYKDGCWANEDFTHRPVCTYGHGPVRIALVGNSHAGQWLPALQELAGRRNLTITTFLLSRCNVTDAALELRSEQKTRNCLDYGRWVMERTKGDQFDLVITSARQSVPIAGGSWKDTEAPAVAGYESYLAKWAAAGTNVLVIKDPPYPGRQIRSIPDCLAENAGRISACDGTPASWHWMDPLTKAVDRLSSPRITAVDLDKYFCAANRCPAVIGSVLVYRDGSHLTATYARSLAPYLDRPIREALAAHRSGTR
ncbi:acyltransferase family protein, partial [Arthrobacter sp. GCM10027362]|uniref:acyltransferase family protein n=1 Tax=Arthrobacter sp. GCM10027362 TaxID=3273379 RepID=UPI003644E8D7